MFPSDFYHPPMNPPKSKCQFDAWKKMLRKGLGSQTKNLVKYRHLEPRIENFPNIYTMQL